MITPLIEQFLVYLNQESPFPIGITAPQTLPYGLLSLAPTFFSNHLPKPHLCTYLSGHMTLWHEKNQHLIALEQWRKTSPLFHSGPIRLKMGTLWLMAQKE
jgi:hypothetical protein